MHQRNCGRGSFSKRGVCNVKGTSERLRLGSETTTRVCFDNRNSDVRMEQDQRETGGYKANLKSAKDLEMKEQEGEKRHTIKAIKLLVTL